VNAENFATCPVIVHKQVALSCTIEDRTVEDLQLYTIQIHIVKPHSNCAPYAQATPYGVEPRSTARYGAQCEFGFAETYRSHQANRKVFSINNFLILLF